LVQGSKFNVVGVLGSEFDILRSIEHGAWSREHGAEGRGHCVGSTVQVTRLCGFSVPGFDILIYKYTNKSGIGSLWCLV